MVFSSTDAAHKSLPAREHRVGPASADGLHIDLPHIPMEAEVALAALSNLPTPVLVLSSLKTVLLANAAVKRLFGVDQDDLASPDIDSLKGQTLSQLGIDMISEGVPIWVSWEKFLDSLSDGSQNFHRAGISPGPSLLTSYNGQINFAGTSNPERGRSSSRDRTTKTPDTVVDVIISSHNHQLNEHVHPPRRTKARPRIQATCRMIISVWAFDGHTFFTLTFTSSEGPPSQPPSYPSSARNDSSHSTRSSQSSHSQTPLSSNSTSQVTSHADKSNGTSFPSIAPPPQCGAPPTFTDFQKVWKMKDAMLRAVEIPLIAMWRDESVVLPNTAARKLLAVDTDPASENSYDFMSRFRPWAADFSRELEGEANPIVALCRTQKGFTNWQIGLLDEKTGDKANFDVSGHPVYDERSGDFLAGLVAFKDVTEYTKQIANKTAENDAQFRLICDMMPQMIWTTRPDGYHDYFSQRWYDYTGLTPAHCMGLGWKLPFHEEDMPATLRRWSHSLATGDEYITEYRCRRYDGEWRWMLGRALPMRDHKTGEIIKWFGSCTDIQDIVDAKANGQRSRQQLLDVLKHSQMTMWIIDREMKIAYCEGDFLLGDPVNDRIIGRYIHEITKGRVPPRAAAKLHDATSRILAGTSDLEIIENEVKGQWYRSKMVPLKGKTGPNRVMDEDSIVGVVVIGSDVTGLRNKEQENIKLLANETAAKEASKMKSSFLANMSHEIRTPIAGVLGMSELLMDTNLDAEQSEFAQNIQRSANSLLTVINDILDFSKIESGRLDIDEVQFSLGVVLGDVAKMLSFAAERKGLEFSNDVHLGPSEDLILLGDPGRIRQIMVNLLTNSIKFTSEGYVRMSTSIVSDTSDTVTVEFCVEDSGIGIEEEVKKRLFQPFSQADSSTARRFGGTGLGLTISRNLVHLMHGAISLDSKLDAGTKATFTIPFKRIEYQGGSPTTLLEVGSMPDRLQSDLSLSIGGSPRPDSRKAEIPAPAFKSPPTSLGESRVSIAVPVPQAAELLQREKIHILVVEDNPVNQQIALKFIQALKFSASAVWNGREALEYLLEATSPNITAEQEKLYPLPSLILMDVQMPVLDGYHATHILRHHVPFINIDAIPQIPIVAMTASAIQGDREKCERAGMDDYMAKPVKRALLESTILKWVSHGRLHAPTIETTTQEKPTLGRTCTSHSSTCSQSDSIALEFYARNADSLPPGSSLKASGQAAARRSSISRAILETEIPGGESQGDIAMRRAAAEDKARILRDAKLLSATDLDLVQPIVASQVSIDGGHALDPQASDLGTGHEGPGITLMALTEQNISLLNHTQESHQVVCSGSPSPENGSEGLTYAIPDIPGPPPEGTLAAIDVSQINIEGAITASSTLSDSLGPSPSEDKLTVLREPVQPLRQTRSNVGGLRPGSRQNSDWSTSTARPDTG